MKVSGKELTPHSFYNYVFQVTSVTPTRMTQTDVNLSTCVWTEYADKHMYLFVTVPSVFTRRLIYGEHALPTGLTPVDRNSQHVNMSMYQTDGDLYEYL